MSISTIIEKKLSSIQEQFPDATVGKSPDIADGINFMLYASNVIFSDFDFEKVEEGIIDSAYRDTNHDYGIDSVCITCNRSYLNSIEELDEYNSDSKIEFHLLQFKKGTGSDQASFLKFKEGISKCFIENSYDLNVNEYLFHRFQFVHEIKDRIYERFDPNNIKISLYFVFGGIKDNVFNDPLLNTQIKDIKKLLSDSCYQNVNFEVIGAQDLIQQEKTGKEIVDIIHYEKTFKYITDTADPAKKLTGHICILKGDEIAQLVKKYQTALFEANIRDFYRSNDLNSNILKTSSDIEESKYFWSYNNGLTITCRKVDELPNDKYKLHGIQIVNGCQTSNALYIAYKNDLRFRELNEKGTENLSKSELIELEKIKNTRLCYDTSILARIIETNDSNLTYRITETTNSQTPIKSFTLKANDDIQKIIQEYLLLKGIFYERRINFYKNMGKKNPISIQHLFQLNMSHIYIKPSQVKTRPASMFNDYYDHVFPSPQRKNVDCLIFYISIKVDMALKHKIRQIKRDNLETDAYILQLYSNGRFHLGCFFLHSILKNKYSYKGIIKNPDMILSVIDSADDTSFNSHFHIAASNFKKVVQNFAGLKKESVPTALRKTELDSRIHKFIQSNRE